MCYRATERSWSGSNKTKAASSKQKTLQLPASPRDRQPNAAEPCLLHQKVARATSAGTTMATDANEVM